MSDNYLFVYGTLRNSYQETYAPSPLQQLINKKCTFIAEGWVQGKLYLISHFPGLITKQDLTNNKVIGDLYCIKHNHASLLAQLDEYEECSPNSPQPHLYCRQKLTVFLNNGETIEAWTYIYNQETLGLTEIKSGDFIEYIKQKPTD